MGNKTVKNMKMFPIDQGVVESLQEEVQRLSLIQFIGNTRTVRTCTYTQNPLLIYEVMESVFPLLDFKSQLASRLVCKLWHEICTPILRPNAIVHFQECKNGTTSPFSDFLKIFDDSPSFPLSKMTMVLPENGLTQHDFNLFRTFGNDIVELTITPTRHGSSAEFVKLLYFLLQSLCPNLRHLNLKKLHNIDFRGIPLTNVSPDFVNLKSLQVELIETFLNSNPHTTMDFLKYFIKRTPNLDKLSTDFKYSKRLFVRFFIGVRAVGINSNLVELDLQQVGLNEKHMELLNTITFPKLKVLKLESINQNSVAEPLMVFLHGVRTTLEKLIFLGDVGNQKTMFKLQQRTGAGVRMNFPSMEKLKVFENWNSEGYQLGCIHFLKQFPVLEEMILEDFGLWAVFKASPWRDLFPEQIDPESLSLLFGTVRKLRMKAILRPYARNLESFHRLLVCFPKLESFSTLVSLNMNTSCKGIREFLAILSTSGIKELSLGLRDCCFLSTPDMKSFEDLLVTYLPKFKNLQKLTLMAEDMTTGSKLKLTKDGISEGFCRMKSLSTLSLVGFGFNGTEKKEITQILDRKMACLEIRDVDHSFF